MGGRSLRISAGIELLLSLGEREGEGKGVIYDCEVLLNEEGKVGEWTKE